MSRDNAYAMVDSSGNIIEFTDQQKKCLDYNGRSALVIKGSAGSGKSLMLVKSALNIRDELIETGSKKKIAIMAYNKVLVSTTKRLLELNGIGRDDPYIDVVGIDALLARICRMLKLIPSPESDYDKSSRYVAYNQRHSNSNYVYKDNNITNDKRLEIIKDVLIECKRRNGHHVFYDYDPQFWAEEIEWMYCNGIVDADDIQTYLKINREGRCKRYATKMRESSRKIAFDIFNAYNSALMKRDYFEWNRLYAQLYRDKLDDMPSSAYYDYVLIDEAQDFSLIKIGLAIHLCREGKENLIIAMDKNQSLYGYRWSFKRDLNLDVHVKKVTVSKRSTAEIDLLARDLKKRDDSLLEAEDRYEDETSTLVSKKLPTIFCCTNEMSELCLLAKMAKEFYQQDVRKAKGGVATFAILVQDNQDINKVQTYLQQNGIACSKYRDKDFDALSPGVKLVTIHSAKGLGFTKVAIPFFNEGKYPKPADEISSSLSKGDGSDADRVDVEDAIAEEISDSRRLVYVAITRAMLDLYIIYHENPSRFICEFEEEHYKLLDEDGEKTSDSKIENNRAIFYSFTVQDSTSMSESVGPGPEAINEDVVGRQSSEQSSYHSPMSVVTDPLVDRLISQGFEVQDRRSKGGPLWVIDGPDVREFMSTLRNDGYNFVYAPRGSRGTGHRPGWYL